MFGVESWGQDWIFNEQIEFYWIKFLYVEHIEADLNEFDWSKKLLYIKKLDGILLVIKRVYNKIKDAI